MRNNDTSAAYNHDLLLDRFLSNCTVTSALYARTALQFHDGWRNQALSQASSICSPFSASMSSIKRDVKKKVLPRPEGEKILSRDPAHFTVRVPLDLRERFCF